MKAMVASANRRFDDNVISTFTNPAYTGKSGAVVDQIGTTTMAASSSTAMAK